MSDLIVGSTAALNNALHSAQDGDTILLQGGTYTGLDYMFNNLNFAHGITITSADPSNPATITHFIMQNSSGINFSNLTMQTQSTGYFDFQVYTSNNIHFDHVSVHGSLDGNPQNDIEGIQVSGSNNISITNSEFQQLERAMAIGSSNNVVVSNNNVHDVEITGVMFAQVGNVTVANNMFSSFHVAAGDHADAIQFLTAGTTTASSDIAISRNLIYRGKGGAAQGIFLRDQVGTLPYQGVIIAENLIVGTGYNGILVMGAKTLAVTDNELVSNPGSTNDTWILVQAADGVTLNHNRAEKISVDTSTNVTQKANKLTEPVGDGGVGALRAWASSHPDKAHDVALLIPND